MVVETPMGKAGMLLKPSEAFLFPEVEPMWRSRGKVLACQMALEPCPHWRDNNCAIYERRPLACRSYPIVHIGHEGVLLESTCPVTDEIVGQRLEGAEEEEGSHLKVDRFLRWVAKQPGLEFYDLATKKWRNMQEIMPQLA